MRRPREPAAGECCGSGCTRCVWDIYYDEVAKFEDFIANGGVEDEVSDSSEEDEVVSYVGTVVVKYLTPPSQCTTAAAKWEDWEREEMRRRDMVLIEKVELVQSSVANLDPVAPGINVISVHSPPPAHPPLPGDVVEILVPNSSGIMASDDVDRLCRALSVAPETWCELHRSPFVPENDFPPWLPLEEQLTVRNLLSLYVDISSSSYLLHRGFFAGLLRIYNNAKAASQAAAFEAGTPEAEKVRLLEVCASTDKGPELFRKLLNRASPLCYPSLVDVLETFSFMTVPLERLLEVSGPLQPRKFSVASYNPVGASPAPLQLCMREVCAFRSRSLEASGASGDLRDLAELLNGATRQVPSPCADFFLGHTSHPLCCAARMGQDCASLPARRMYISYSLFGSSAFAQQLQAGCIAACNPGRARNPQRLLLLIGCGTGVAPLIAAVSQLMHCRTSASGDEPPYPCWVFYGAKKKAELLYDGQLKAALSMGAISRYEYSLSRDSDERMCKPHVTDLLKDHGAAVASALLGSGQLFVCGPASMLRSVRGLLEQDLLAEADDDESVREQRILLLEEQGKINFDIWSTGNVFA